MLIVVLIVARVLGQSMLHALTHVRTSSELPTASRGPKLTVPCGGAIILSIQLTAVDMRRPIKLLKLGSII